MCNDIGHTSTFTWQYIHMHQMMMIKYTTTLNKINKNNHKGPNNFFSL